MGNYRVPEKLSCPVCSRLYLKTKANKPHRPYCSSQCKREETEEKYPCKKCGKLYLRVFPNQLFCSKPCQLEFNEPRAKLYRDSKKEDSDFLIFKRDNFQCVYCGASAHKGASLHLDHVYPKSRGGGNDVFNLVTSCSKCNLEKTSHPLSEQKTMELWRRNLQLDIKFGNITSYEVLKEIFIKKYKPK